MGSLIFSKEQLNSFKAFCESVQSSNTVNIFETPDQQKARISRALTDYNFFVITYFEQYADCDCAPFHIKAAVRICIDKRPTDDPNLIAVLEWPREHAKSVHADVLIPMWKLAQGTLNGMILVGKNQEDACVLLSDIQAQLQYNPLFIHDFGEQFNLGDWTAGDFTTKNGIRFKAIGRDQTPRGARKGEKRPNYAVVDDVDDDIIVNNQKRVRAIVERILGALFFGLDTKKGGTLVIAGNRIHQKSILAHIVGDIKPGAPKRKGIFHSKIYAIDPKTGQPSWARYTYGQIMNKIAAVGNAIGRKEFFHENNVQGTVFLDKYFHWIKMRDLRIYKIIIGYFDPSFENNPTSDFKAVRVWGGLTTPLGDWIRHCITCMVRQTNLKEVYEWMSATEDKLPPGVGILWYVEKQFFNRPIKDALKAHNKLRKRARKKVLTVLVDSTKKDGKYLRMMKMEPSYANNENFYNLDKLYDPDMIEGNNQLKGIEPGYAGADDSPDSDQGAWNLLDQHQPEVNFKPRVPSTQKQRL